MTSEESTKPQIESTTIKLERNLIVEINSYYVEVFSTEYQDSEENRKILEIKYFLTFSTDFDGELILHWGLVFKNNGDWIAPSKDILPINSKIIDAKSAQTKFDYLEDSKDRKKIKINLSITNENLIKSLKFVIYNPHVNKWYNNDKKDFIINFKNLKNEMDTNSTIIPNFVEDIITCEVDYGSWTLMHRYNKCYDILNNLDLSNYDDLIWIYIWLRYSYTRQLDWQRRFNTKPRELAHSMNRLTIDITNKFCSSLANKLQKIENQKFELSTDILMRMYLSLLGKGTGDGQKIRDEILQILHKHNIKETNDHFYEQWHQKLHNNTTPDDMVICQAVIEFLKSGGKIDVYWKVLNSNGISKERLASFERKILCEPFYKPELIPDLENFLFTLKSVHSTNDLNLMFQSAKYAFKGNDFSQFDEIIKNIYHWDTLRQIYRVTDGRELLWRIIKGNLKDSNKIRDLLFFDLCLENYLRQLIEKIIHLNLEFDQFVSEITAIVKNLIITYNFKELGLCLEDWVQIAETLKKNIYSNKFSALKIKSVADRMSRVLTHVIDYFNINYDEKARHLGNSFKIEKYVVDIFTEETIRGTIFFTLSMILKKIEATLRKCANLGSWLIISRGKYLENGKDHIRGKICFVKSLQEVQMRIFEKQTVLLTSHVGGNEEIPVNVTCLITIYSKDYPDVLSHVSVRARNLGLPLIVCFEDSISDSLMKLENKIISIKIVNQIVEFNEISEIENDLIDKEDATSDSNLNFNKIQSVNIPKGFLKTVIQMDEFCKNNVGAKSNNSKLVFGNLPLWIKYPESIAIPFNVCEYFLDLYENSDINEKIKKYQKLLKSAKGKKISEILAILKEEMMNLKYEDDDHTEELKEELMKFGINDFKAAWSSIKGVWASKYNERAFIATQKVGISLENIRMAILVQKIIPADFAYVIHTKNPSTNNEDEIYAEVVVGMGETLVGTYEGQSFSFTYNKKNCDYIINSYPNKSIVLKNSGFIFRSDSNTEDLEGFAGAGLFDSIPISNNIEIQMSYFSNGIFNDENFIQYLINKIGQMGIEVEKIYNYPQDIEGVLYKNEFFIVQTRPQV